MVYDWAGKEGECYQWYVVERKSLDDLMKHMKATYGFEPSKRAYQTQFRRWNFPSKQSPAYQDADLVDRIRQLWEKNCGQKDMLRILKEEGWQIKERELLRVRTKHGWLLRGANGFQATYNKQRAGLKRKVSQHEHANGEDDYDHFHGADSMSEVPELGLAQPDSEHHMDPASGSSRPPVPRPDAVSADPDVEAKRQARHSELLQHSDELWAAKKRRRRTRGWAGLPADPPGPPRFPSETTLDESKAFLHLNNEQYQAVRDTFIALCQEENIVKKSQAGADKWQAVKDRLVSENPDLHREFYGPFNGVPEASKKLAVDVICMDVTKRMRTAEQRMTISEAKVVLALNPAQSRLIRSEFYDVLHADHFVSKLEAGVDHFNEMKQNWMDSSSLVQEILSSSGGPGNDVHYAQKLKAFEVLCRDVMKRIRDDVTRADPTRKREGPVGPGPGPAQPRVAPALSRPPVDVAQQLFDPSHSIAQPTLATRPVPSKSRRAQRAQPPSQETQIDPSLVATSDPTLAQLQAFAASAAADVPPQPSSTLPHPLAALFRLHPSSTYPAAQKVWFGTLTTASISELVAVAGATHGPGVMVRKMEGVFSNHGGGGGEMPFPIERDDEVAAYLQFVEGVGDGRYMFLVTLDRAHG